MKNKKWHIKNKTFGTLSIPGLSNPLCVGGSCVIQLEKLSDSILNYQTKGMIAIKSVKVEPLSKKPQKDPENKKIKKDSLGEKHGN